MADILGLPPESATIRRPKIKIEVDRWNWETGYIDTIDITEAIMSYNWQKSIKSPTGGATLQLLPQTQFQHLLDDITIMDVIKIYEFDTLKFQGYIRRVGSTGYIDEAGKPHRTGTFQCTTFGGFLLESIVSVNVQILENSQAFKAAAVALANSLGNSGTDSISYNMEVFLVVEAWKSFIASTSSSTIYLDYMNRYINFFNGMTTNDTPGYPRELFLFYGEEDEVNLWEIIEKLAEAPLNEFFFDDGPRIVIISGAPVWLPEGKTYLIGRETPFDGTYKVGGPSSLIGPYALFRSMKPVVIPNNHLVKYDLNKSTDEMFSHYVTAPSMYDPSRQELLASGEAVIDPIAYGKYLYRLCNKSLYYVTNVDHSTRAISPSFSLLKTRAWAVSKSLYEWYRYNDQFLSGTIDFMVPSVSLLDPRIGNKVEIEDVDGAFYAEGITHTWNYQGPLKSTAHVTRGWNVVGPIKLKNRIFKKPMSPHWKIDIAQRA